MSFVEQQRQLPVLKQFLKLYTTISLPKLAALMDTDEAAVKEQLRVLEVKCWLLLVVLSHPVPVCKLERPDRSQFQVPNATSHAVAHGNCLDCVSMCACCFDNLQANCNSLHCLCV